MCPAQSAEFANDGCTKHEGLLPRSSRYRRNQPDCRKHKDASQWGAALSRRLARIPGLCKMASVSGRTTRLQWPLDCLAWRRGSLREFSIAHWRIYGGRALPTPAPAISGASAFESQSTNLRMAKYKRMPGNGVGNDVMEATRIVLDRLKLD